jgi:hypothetical protein
VPGRSQSALPETGLRRGATAGDSVHLCLTSATALLTFSGITACLHPRTPSGTVQVGSGEKKLRVQEFFPPADLGCSEPVAGWWALVGVKTSGKSWRS